MARPRVHDDALRRRLLEVTSQVVASAGPDAVTVRDVAGRAGTSASAVYALYGSRDALLAAVTDEGFRRFAERLAAAPRGTDPRVDLLALGLAYRENALAEPHFYRVMFAGPGPADGGPTTEPPATDRATFRVLQDAVGRVLASGGRTREAEEDSAREGALALWALVHGLVSLELAGLMPGSADERTDRYVRALRTAGAALLA